ncbi:MAG TPA: hypothetical protein VNX68_04595, partial [Nitrosopumilaceae archaeon]|nr:hypothetical protein [Nitrosopumilaceae archaeon]
KTIFEKIGSWDMQHDSEAVLIKKFKEWHAIEIGKFREDRKKLALANRGISHGRENGEQRRSIDHDELGANGVRKAESYLPH